MQVSAAARNPGRTYIANPPASWLDDFLSWISPGLPHCCREGPQGQQCPPPDQFPCNTSATACADCATCFTSGGGPGPRTLPHNRPTLDQVSCTPLHAVDAYKYHECMHALFSSGLVVFTAAILGSCSCAYEEKVLAACQVFAFHHTKTTILCTQVHS